VGCNTIPNIKSFKFNPIKPLLCSKTHEIVYFVERDLLEKEVGPISEIWNLPEPQKMLKQQNSEGYWESKSKKANKYPLINYNLLETWKKLRVLIEKFQFNKSHQNIEKACEFVFSCQTDEGDIRGFLAKQYAMYYTGAILSLLIKAGYNDDSRTQKAITWLLNMRQNDGGWVATP
jgi:prenyltransferase beta subunit